jgi:hypothetical protein
MELKIARTAHELALMFEVESDIPLRFRKSKSKKLPDPDVERRWQKHLLDWQNTIISIIDNVSDQDQAWRFILTNPRVDVSSSNRVTECQDFLDFTDLFNKRRDIDKCDDIELGTLSILYTAFQRKIERLINK